MSKIKLPKQWKHWCSKMNLRPAYPCRSRWDYFYVNGRGFVWRVNCHGHFERGDTHQEFDRWALCNIDYVETIPQTFDEFKATVISLCEMHNPAQQLGE